MVTDGMHCNKCKGRVFVDRTFSEKKHIELACVLCGKRWMLDKEKNRFAKWLLEREQEHANAVALTSA